MPLSIITGGFALAALLIVTGPTLESRPTVANTPLVRIIEAKPQQIQLRTLANGTVTPRTESELVPEVAGSIVEMSAAMVSGGFFSAGDVLVVIDPLDYEVALEQAEAGLTRAQSSLGNAERSYTRQQDLAIKQSTSESQTDDALDRLRGAEAGLREAKARRSKAKRDLQRTKLIAPYDGRVRSERVDVGQFVSRGNAIATLYATDIAEVKLPIRDSELAFLSLPLTASTALTKPLEVIFRANFAGAEHQWQGQVVRTEGELDPRTRMINVVAQVRSPYAQHGNRPPLAVGLFVDAEIKGNIVDNVVTLPRVALRGESQVYIVDADNRLRFRQVDILRVAQGQVFISAGLQAGDRVCISALDSALDGMTVKVQSTVAVNSQ